jgi:hypothetical protein
LPPVGAAPVFAIRKPPVAVFTLGDYVVAGIMIVDQAETLRAAIAFRANILVAILAASVPSMSALRSVRCAAWNSSSRKPSSLSHALLSPKRSTSWPSFPGAAPRGGSLSSPASKGLAPDGNYRNTPVGSLGFCGIRGLRSRQANLH